MDHWHNGAAEEIRVHALALHRAARALAAKNPTGEDVGPVILLYRQAMELHLKTLIDTGNNFLKSPTDPISLCTTRSLRWLASIVCQIVKAAGWQGMFTCEGISNLAEFKAAIGELESLQPVQFSILARGAPYPLTSVTQYAAKLDALIELLTTTIEALEKAWAEHTMLARLAAADPGKRIQ